MKLAYNRKATDKNMPAGVSRQTPLLAMSNTCPWLLLLASTLMLFVANSIVFDEKNIVATASELFKKMRGYNYTSSTNKTNIDDTQMICPFDVDVSLKRKKPQSNDDGNRQSRCVSKLLRYSAATCDPLQPLLCMDFQDQSEHERNGESFIVIKNVLGNETLFRQWVAFGGFFKISSADGFRYDIHNVTIYNSEEMTTDTMIQSLLLNAPCDTLGPSAALTATGSIQLMGTAVDNPKKAAPHSLEYQINIGVDAKAAAMTLRDLVVTSNVDGIGWLNLSADVAGKPLSPGTNDTITLGWVSEDDLTEVNTEAPPAFLVTVKAATDSGETCIMTKLLPVDEPV